MEAHKANSASPLWESDALRDNLARRRNSRRETVPLNWADMSDDLLRWLGWFAEGGTLPDSHVQAFALGCEIRLATSLYKSLPAAPDDPERPLFECALCGKQVKRGQVKEHLRVKKHPQAAALVKTMHTRFKALRAKASPEVEPVRLFRQLCSTLLAEKRLALAGLADDQDAQREHPSGSSNREPGGSSELPCASGPAPAGNGGGPRSLRSGPARLQGASLPLETTLLEAYSAGQERQGAVSGEQLPEAVAVIGGVPASRLSYQGGVAGGQHMQEVAPAAVAGGVSRPERGEVHDSHCSLVRSSSNEVRRRR